MRYLFAVIAERDNSLSTDPDEIKAIDTFNDKIEREGKRIMAVGIAAPDKAMLYDNRAGAGKVRQGPAVDAELFMAGFWILELGNESEIENLASEASQACNRLIEVRPFL